TDIYVFGIVYNSLRVRSTVYLTLKVDGAKVDTYFHPPRDDNTFDYRVPVFAIHNLTDTTHDIDVEMEENSHFIFDSLVYNSGTGTGPGTGTTSSGSTSSTGGIASSSSGGSKKMSIGAIIGIVIGAVLFLTLVAGLLFYWTKRHNKRLKSGSNAKGIGQPGVEPYMLDRDRPTLTGPSAPSGTTSSTFFSGNQQPSQHHQFQPNFRNQPSVPIANGYLPVSTSTSPFSSNLQPAVAAFNPAPMKYANNSQQHSFYAPGSVYPDDRESSLATGSEWNDGSNRRLIGPSSAQWMYPNGGGSGGSGLESPLLPSSDPTTISIQTQLQPQPQLQLHPQRLTEKNMAELNARTSRQQQQQHQQQERIRMDAISVHSAPPPPYPQSSFSVSRAAPTSLPSEFGPPDHEL
ncbi:hypothetical protein FRB91_011820, partial [Serendipita sp. 411]